MWAALAVGLLAVAAAWDFGRRWLRSHERAQEAALIRTREMRDEFSEALATGLDRVRKEIEEVSSTSVARCNSVTKDAAWLGKSWAEKHEELAAKVGILEAMPHEHPDTVKYHNAVRNLGIEMREEFAKRVTHDQLKAYEDRFNATLTGAVAKGARIRA